MASDKKLMIDNNSQPNNLIKGGETKVMKTKKAFNVMTSAALAASVVAPAVAVVAPQDAEAASTDSYVDRVRSIADDYESQPSGSNNTFVPNDAVATLYIKPDDLGKIPAGEEFEVVLPSGVKWVKDAYQQSNSVVKNVYVNNVSDQTLTLEVAKELQKNNDEIEIPLFVKVDGASGEVKVEIRGKDSSIASASHTFAVIGSGKTVATVEDIVAIAPGSTKKIGTIKIEETSIGAIFTNDEQEINIKLPSDVTWANTPTVRFAGGFSGKAQNVQVTTDDEELIIKFTLTGNKPSTRGTIYIEDAELKVDSEVSTGDIEASISGTEVSDEDVIIAKVADYDVEVKVDEVVEVVAGKSDDIKTGKIVIEENVAGTLVAGRDLEVHLPDGVKVVNVREFKATGGGIDVASPTINSRNDRVTFNIKKASSGSEAKIEFKLELTVEGNKTGDLEAEIKGAGLEEQSVVIAKAVAPISVEASKSDVKIGVQDQDAGDIIITENVKGALEKEAEFFNDDDNLTGGFDKEDGIIRLTLPEGVTFSKTPQVTVEDGNIKLGSVKRTNNNRYLEIKVDSESTKPSKIKISGVKLSVDRTVPEGPIELKVGGPAVVENNVDSQDDDIFTTSNAVTIEYATTVTPAPEDETKTAVFTIGSTTYTVNGEEKALDVAPYVENGRTMLPIRYVAEAVGVSEDNIIWNSATRTATFIKGDRIAQVKIGSKVLTINGVNIQMDVEAKVKDGRTVLPLRYVAQALGANVTYDEVAKTVTVESK